MTSQDDRLSQILALIHDPQFAEFELEQEAPSIFNAVGRTHTETWHSALLGWLLDPNSSHQLGSFPLTRLILLLGIQDTLKVEERGVDLNELLAKGDFSKTRVRPNEREPIEVTVGRVRFDVFADNITLESYKEIQVIIEAKVKAPIKHAQCQEYIS